MTKRTLRAVIGANYGDEGKGLMTDYFCSDAPENTLVVRFNGGAQAGHTVQLENGSRFVFSHIGAGSFRGVPTFLSKYFLVNPLLFAKEQKTFRNTGFSVPTIIVDPRCYVTLPYDMLINAAIERKRGKNRHGSCGVGINETIVRNQEEAFRLTVSDTLSYKKTRILNVLESIKRHYVPYRLRQLALPQDSLKHDEGDWETLFLTMMEEFHENTVSALWKDFEWNGNVVFEGAQGLRLDENYPGGYPHVTRSNTGAKNVLALLAEKQINETLEIVYTTRWYQTRHGAGPMSHELACPPEGVYDQTNVENEFQGKLRYGLLDINDLLSDVYHDLHKNFSSGAPKSYQASLAITCLDQANANTSIVKNGSIYTDRTFSVIGWALDDLIARNVFGKVYASYGPTAQTIFQFDLSHNQYIPWFDEVRRWVTRS